jgi:cardiolipin synthase
MLCRISGAHFFKDCSQRYFSSGEDYMASLLEDLRRAEKFIYMEYFIIEEGKFWTAILSVLKEKVLSGVDVKVVYDDIGCMTKLPGNYYKTLKRYGILATPFSKIRGSADSEFNNRSHRKITVIDGKVGYTGGVNIADEYINEKDVYGHFKDGGVRIEGESVWELTKLFLIDYGMNAKNPPFISNENFPQNKVDGSGFTIPFGDGPMPLYTYRVSKSAIQNMVNSANEYAYITTPYLIIDNALCQDLENCALRGVDVKIIIPGVPDKKIVYEITKSYCERLVRSGVKIYVYKKGFIHAKNYLVDDKFAIVGTSNLDYRSLVHHLENGVWMYKCDCIKDIKSDFVSTLNECELFKPRKRNNFVVRFLRSVVRIFAPLL